MRVRKEYQERISAPRCLEATTTLSIVVLLNFDSNKAGEIYPPPDEIYPPFEIYPPRLFQSSVALYLLHQNGRPPWTR